jgi:hypothetical protein
MRQLAATLPSRRCSCLQLTCPDPTVVAMGRMRGLMTFGWRMASWSGGQALWSVRLSHCPFQPCWGHTNLLGVVLAHFLVLSLSVSNSRPQIYSEGTIATLESGLLLAEWLPNHPFPLDSANKHRSFSAPLVGRDASGLPERMSRMSIARMEGHAQVRRFSCDGWVGWCGHI